MSATETLDHTFSRMTPKMKVIAFIAEHAVVDAILRHLATAETKSPRGPPGAAALSVAS
jgi:hypothetical protein